MATKSREAFAMQLQSTIIPSNLSSEDQKTKWETLQKAANECLPRSLYRFRDCSEQSISAFDKDALWVSTADCMNDGFDTRIYINKEEIEAAINRFTQNQISKETLIRNIESNPVLPPEFTPFIEQLKSFSEENIKQTSEQFKKWIMSDTAEALLQISSVAQQVLKFCCFSENLFSPVMWGIYAKNESGFALEYDFSEMPYTASPNQFSRECTLFPIIYNDKRYQVSTEYILYLLEQRLFRTAFINSGLMRINPGFVQQYLESRVCPDLLMGTKISLYKSDEWQREAEWRLFCTSINDPVFQNEKHGCCIKKPTAIYLGRRISPINEKIMRKLAEEKEIPVHKMTLDDQSASYELKMH